MGERVKPLKTFRVFTLQTAILGEVWVSKEDTEPRQNRAVYAENRNRIGVTYMWSTKSLEETVIRKVCNKTETSGKFVNFYFVL